MAVEEHAVEGSLADARRAGDDDGAGVGRSCLGGRGRVKRSQPVCLLDSLDSLGECREDAYG